MSLITRVSYAFQIIKQQFNFIFGKTYPPNAIFCLAEVPSFPRTSTPKKINLSDILGDGFLWAVPKHRRTVEKRWKRKFGDPYYVNKLLLPKSYLKTCNECGDNHEAGVLCPTCYKKVIEETKAMQTAIQEKLKLEPVEHEIVVLYQGEKDAKPDEFCDGKRIVEMKKPRPSWFTKNLLQNTTQKPAQTSDVKPTDLG